MNNNTSALNGTIIDAELASAIQAAIPPTELDRQCKPDLGLVSDDLGEPQEIDISPEVDALITEIGREVKAKFQENFADFCDAEGGVSGHAAESAYQALMASDGIPFNDELLPEAYADIEAVLHLSNVAHPLATEVLETSAEAKNHASALVKFGFPQSFVEQPSTLSVLPSGNLGIATSQGVFEFSLNEKSQYECVTPFTFMVPALSVALHPDFEDVLFVTKNPLVAILGASLGVKTVAINGDAWISPGVTSTRPKDAIHAVQQAIPRAEIAQLVAGHRLVLDDSFGQSDLIAHAFKYHVCCYPFFLKRILGVRFPLLPMITNGEKGFADRTEGLEPLVVRIPYDKFGDQVLNYLYSIIYPASDDLAKNYKEIVKKVTDKDGVETSQVILKPLENVPHCRVKYTILVNPMVGNCVSLDKTSATVQVIERMEGFSSSKSAVEWNNGSSDFSEKNFSDRNFYATIGGITELRKMISYQKGQKSHPVVLGTKTKGFISIKNVDGSVVNPAGYVADDKVLMKPGMPEIYPVGLVGSPLSKKGTVEVWRKIIKLVLKNSSIAALMGFGASSLILPFVQNAEPGFIALIGKSGFGKTSAMKAVASMFSVPTESREPGSPMMGFRGTDNALEGKFEGKNHFVALLDEIGAATAGMDWAAFGYMVVNGVGKARMTSDITLREMKTWLTQTIATGEVSYASQMEKNGQSERGGLLFRVVDLHISGIPFWEHLAESVSVDGLGEYQDICDEYYPGASERGHVLDAIFTGLMQNHGHAWWEMVEMMFDENSRAIATKRFRDWKNVFTAKLPNREEPIVHRRSVHLASCMGGLELLLDTMQDVLTVEERAQIISGAASWVENYLWRAGLSGGLVDEDLQMIEKVLEYIALNPGRFFDPVNDDVPRSFKQYWGKNHGGSGVTLFVSGLKDVCKDLDLDYQRVRTALLNQKDGEAWKEDNMRPAPGANPIRGFKSPDTFGLLG